MPTCFTTREEFMEYLRASLGEMNAEIKFGGKTTVRFATKYTLLANNIEHRAERIGAKVLHTITDDGLHVVSVKGFGSKTWVVR